MKLPRATYNFGKSVAEMFSFSGISHKAGAKDGEIYDMKNISLDNYPCLTVRKKRQLLDFDIKRKVYGIGSADKLFWCADDEFGEAYFYYDGEKVFPVEKSEKTFAVINKYICIFPDKKYFSLWRDEAVNLDAEKGITLYENLKLLNEGGTTDENIKDGDVFAVGLTEPYSYFQYNSQGKWNLEATTENHAVQTRWVYLMDSWGSLEGTKSILANEYDTTYDRKSYISGERLFGDVETPYIALYYYKNNELAKENILSWLRIGDTFAIKKTKDSNNEIKTEYAKLIGKAFVKDFLGGYDYMVYYLDKKITLSETSYSKVTIERTVPELEFAFCHGNRLWGIEGDKICASKLGDPFNFQDFSLLADASWQVAVASSGPFTGGCVYNGYPTFFKEDSIIRVAGNYPSQYSTYETNDVAGVLKGSEKSLAIANGALFYLSPQGIARYTGSYPSIVSDALGKVLSYGRAGAGADKYYLEAIDEEGEKAVYVLDTKINAWTKEEALFSAGFTDMGRELYAIGDGGIYLIDSERELFDDSETIESFIEFAPIYEGSLKKKGLSKLLVNLSVKDGSEVRIYLSYDGGEWILMKKWSTGGIHTVPLTIKRCGNYRIRISGEGEYKLLALSRERYLGSERG